MNMFEGIDQGLVNKFLAFHAANPDVYSRFTDLALQMRSTGRAKYSAWTIINKIRWDQDISTTGSVFLINNDFIALYARMAMIEHAELEGFFEKRRMKSHDRRDSADERYRKPEAIT